MRRAWCVAEGKHGSEANPEERRPQCH
jgi:hypothetical protein